MSEFCEISGARLPRPGRGESLSMDEAAAFRAGAEAMREAAARKAEATADAGVENESWDGGITAWEAAQIVAEAIRALPLPEPPASLTADGLCGRGA